MENLTIKMQLYLLNYKIFHASTPNSSGYKHSKERFYYLNSLFAHIYVSQLESQFALGVVYMCKMKTKYKSGQYKIEKM